jgi:hypothetical protein
MVKGLKKRSKSFAENDPLRIRMSKERQEHAKRQDHDYSHVFRWVVNEIWIFINLIDFSQLGKKHVSNWYDYR